MTEQELQTLVEQISLRRFHRPFKHQAVFNKRLKTTGGRYHLKDHHIDINPKVLELYDEEMLAKVIKHELCHYHLHLTHHGYQHKDASFKKLLKKVGGLRYAPPMPGNKSGKLLTYECTNCHHRYHRKRKIDTKRFVCGKCHFPLKFIEERAKMVSK